MPFTLYEASIPVMTRGLLNLSRLLEKGQAFAEQTGLAENEMLGKRLIEDMFPLRRQVQSACDTAKFCGARLAGITAPRDEDGEDGFAELQARIARTMQFLGAIEVGQLDGRDDAEVVLKTPGGALTFTARNYVTQFSLPNFFFHVSIAYGLLRCQGAPVGKLDYLGAR
jgi:uncharacterized protein